MAKSKYADMPEPPCAEMKAAYKTCLVDRREWRRYHKKASERARFNVVGPYIEDDGRVMIGCIAASVPRRQAEAFAKREAMRRSDYLYGYSPRLVEEMRRLTRVVPESEGCPSPVKAEGLPLDYVGGPEDVLEPGSSQAARKVPMLSGLLGMFGIRPRRR
jgi:hypothetical protein